MPRDFKKNPFFGILGVALLFAMPFLCAENLDPAISPRLVRKLLGLRYGVTNYPSLILRSRHVDLVQFFGGGVQSRHGYVVKDGLIRDGLWLDLRNRGEQPLSSASVKLQNPMDITEYDSLLLWVRPELVQFRLWVGFQDPNWTKGPVAQARTGVFPSPGLNPGETVQVVIPFQAFSKENNFNFNQLSQITFEFGTQSAGNGLFGSLEIFGVAFVRQKTPLAAIKIVRPREASAQVNLEESAGKTAAIDQVKPVHRKRGKGPKAAPASPQFEAKGFALPELAVPAIKQDVSAGTGTETLSPGERGVLGQSPDKSKSQSGLAASPQGVQGPSKKVSFIKNLKIFEGTKTKWALFTFFLILLNAFAFFLFRRSRKLTNQSASRFLYEIKWPVVYESVASHFMNEKKFWKELSGLNVRFAWVSPFQIRTEQTSDKDEYFAENFLHRQIQLAKGAGINLIPSLCFARTLFHYETFLANPNLYLTRQVAYSDRHFSDEELRVKYIGYFPVWIPPYWQKKHNLSERVLVAYGKLPGRMPTSDGVQFNLSSPALRQYAIRLIDRFAKNCVGVRIEGAAALLNSSLYKFWRIRSALDDSGEKAPEFWEEVISAIKAKHPGFLFFADGAGAEVTKMRNLGFDFLENNQLRDILINQIKLEEVGNLGYVLTGALAAQLDRSVHDISPLLRSNDLALKKQQNLLASLILSLLPGMIQHPGIMGGFDFFQFLGRISKIPVLKYGFFKLLQTTSPSVLSFARYDNRLLYIGVANFSLKTQSLVVNLDPFLSSFREKSMYLFHDFLHGSSFFRDLLADSSKEPALAVLGEDLRDGGLQLTIPGLSLRLLSVSLKQQISHESDASKIRQLR